MTPMIHESSTSIYTCLHFYFNGSYQLAMHIISLLFLSQTYNFSIFRYLFRDFLCCKRAQQRPVLPLYQYAIIINDCSDILNLFIILLINNDECSGVTTNERKLPSQLSQRALHIASVRIVTKYTTYCVTALTLSLHA